MHPLRARAVAVFTEESARAGYARLIARLPLYWAFRLRLAKGQAVLHRGEFAIVAAAMPHLRRMAKPNDDLSVEVGPSCEPGPLALLHDLHRR